MDLNSDSDSFLINFAVPELINPKETFSNKNELSQEWPEIIDKVFPDSVSNDFEKDKFLDLSIKEVNWDGESFEFSLEAQRFNEEEKIMVAYMLSKAVQKEHLLDERKVNIEIKSGDKVKIVNF